MDRPLSGLLDDLKHPALLQLARHWLSLRDSHGGIPPLRALDPMQFAPVMKDSWIVDAEPDGGFRFRLAGETLVEWYGHNPKGRTFLEVASPAVAPVLTSFARRVVQGPAITFHRMSSTMPGWEIPSSFERMGLPLGDNEGRVRHLFGATVFDRHYYNGRGAVTTKMEFEYWYPLAEPQARQGSSL